MGALHGLVQRLLLRRQHVEIVLAGGRHGFQRDLQRIAIDPIPQVEKLHADFGVGQEELADVALAQILAHGVVVGKIAIVHQRFVQADERVRAAGMPHAPFGRVTLVGDPNMGLFGLPGGNMPPPARHSPQF